MLENQLTFTTQSLKQQWVPVSLPATLGTWEMFVYTTKTPTHPSLYNMVFNFTPLPLRQVAPIGQTFRSSDNLPYRKACVLLFRWKVDDLGLSGTIHLLCRYSRNHTAPNSISRLCYVCSLESRRSCNLFTMVAMLYRC